MLILIFASQIQILIFSDVYEDKIINELLVIAL